MKRMIYGDGNYQSALWRFSKTSASRDYIRPALSPNGTKLGMTAQILRERPASEADRCLQNDLMSINGFVWDGQDRVVLEQQLWPLVLATRANASWLFSHCLAWEYARLCSVVMRAPGLLRREAEGGPEQWYPVQCWQPDPNQHPMMVAGDWDALGAGPEELQASRRDALAPARLNDAELELALWLTTRNVCDAKTLNFADDGTSAFLYTHISYLYRIGFGEAYLVELMTIVVLSFFLFYTSFFDEAQQLMHQVTLSSTLRCYEDGARPWSSWEACGPASQALRRKVLRRCNRKSWWELAHLYLFLVQSDFMCDFFLSLRVIFLAYMVMATEMITTWDHGVLVVIFSVLAVAFLFEIDDKMVLVLESMGWTDTAFYQAKLLPMMEDLQRKEDEERIRSALAGGSYSLKSLRTWAARGFKKPSLFGQKTVRYCGFVLVSGLFGVHQWFVLQLATQTGTQRDIIRLYDQVFYEWGSQEAGGGYQIGGLCMAIFVAALVNTILYQSLSCLGNLVQLGLCLTWTYAMFREVVINGFLVWYADLRPDVTVESHTAKYLFVDKALIFFPAFILHGLGCLLRPLLFFSRVHAQRGTGPPLTDEELASSSNYSADAFSPVASTAPQGGSHGSAGLPRHSSSCASSSAAAAAIAAGRGDGITGSGREASRWSKAAFGTLVATVDDGGGGHGSDEDGFVTLLSAERSPRVSFSPSCDRARVALPLAAAAPPSAARAPSAGSSAAAVRASWELAAALAIEGEDEIPRRRGLNSGEVGWLGNAALDIVEDAGEA